MPGFYSFAEIKIEVENENDNFPVFNKSFYTAWISENGW